MYPFDAVQGLAKACHLHYQFYKESARPQGQQAANPELADESGLRVIDVPNLNQLTENSYQILSKLEQRFQIPESRRCAAGSLQSIQNSLVSSALVATPGATGSDARLHE